MEHVNVRIKEDDSVEKLLSKKAKDLQSKYDKKRKINEDFLKKKTPLQKTFSIILDVFCVFCVLVAGVVCFSSINSRVQKVSPTFAGYANMVVVSGSMVNSGFNIGDTIIVRSVDTRTLHKNDKIAFYVYPDDYKSFDINTCEVVPDEEIPANSYVMSFSSLLGIQPDKIVRAAKSNSQLVFHHIREVYSDVNGTRWFKTYGSSNTADDVWYISENMVVGLYDESGAASFFSSVISAVNSQYGFLILLIPVIFLAIVISFDWIKAIVRTKLELDCVEEKRKITDPVCVRNNIGFGMDTKTKFKILAQASPEKTNEYLSLLWKNGSAPNNIRKYYTRRNILLDYNRQLLELNRECEKRFKKGEDPVVVAKYYTENKSRLEQEQVAKCRELRAMRS